MQGFASPVCKIHKETTITHICFQNKAKFVCPTCLTKCDCCLNHQKYVMDIPAFIANIEETATNIEKIDSKSMSRHAELTDLAGRFKAQYTKEEDENVKAMMKIIQTQAREYRDMCKRADTQRNKLVAAYNLIRYFQPFHDTQLFEIKMNLSTPKGIKVFIKKAQNHSALLNKRVQAELKKAEADLQAEDKKIADFESNSFTLKLRHLLRSVKKNQEKPVSQMRIINVPIKTQQS